MILEMYGTGNAPSTRQGLLDAVTTATKKGIVVVALTQCRQVRPLTLYRAETGVPQLFFPPRSYGMKLSHKLCTDTFVPYLFAAGRRSVG
jgi:hypothetical protein